MSNHFLMKLNLICLRRTTTCYAYNIAPVLLLIYFTHQYKSPIHIFTHKIWLLFLFFEKRVYLLITLPTNADNNFDLILCMYELDVQNILYLLQNNLTNV